jgi:hypothetical protein
MVDRTSKPVDKERLVYAFGHLVAGHSRPDDAHSSDSLDLGTDMLQEMGLSQEATDAIQALAVHVAGDYEYTGHATEIARRINAGEI